MPTDASDDTPSLAVRCVRALMERHGLPKYRQSAWLADATGLSYAQAHRRMNGAAAWTLEDLEKVAAHFGESLADAVSRVQSQSAVPGVVRIGQANVPCELWVGERLAHPRPDSVVAIRTSTGWAAVIASEAADNVTYALERLHAKPSATERKRIAVLDDDHDLTDSVCAHLQDTGYEAKGYYRTPDLQVAYKAQPFDAYLIDWIVGEGNTLALIAEIRAQSPVPILVLTAQMATGAVDEDEIAAAVSAHDLVFTEKPVRMSILSASLSRALSA